MRQPQARKEGARRVASHVLALARFATATTGNTLLTANMNWTGGALQRTKNANKGVIQKQRAYFARARTKLQQSSETLATPFHPDFLQVCADFEYGGQSHSASSGSMRHGSQSVRQRQKGRERHASPAVRRQRCGDDQGTLHTSSHFLQNVEKAFSRGESRQGHHVDD